jgi:peptidoglycan-associated lipoprotein
MGALAFVLLIGGACSKSLQNTGLQGSTNTPPTAEPLVVKRDAPAATKPGTPATGPMKSAEASLRPTTSAADGGPSSGSPGGAGTGTGAGLTGSPRATAGGGSGANGSASDLSGQPSPTFPSLSSVEPGESLATSKSAGEQVIPPTDIVVAKADSGDSARRRAEDMRREQLATAAAGLEDVFFAFDSFQLSSEAKQALMLDAEWMRSNPDKPVLIEGHCDERGTLAYNLVLGEKRAKVVEKYLAELGVGQNRLSVVSYGKERPFCKDRDESCYQKNRRGHIVLRVN